MRATNSTQLNTCQLPLTCLLSQYFREICYGSDPVVRCIGGRNPLTGQTCTDRLANWWIRRKYIWRSWRHIFLLKADRPRLRDNPYKPPDLWLQTHIEPSRPGKSPGGQTLPSVFCRDSYMTALPLITGPGVCFHPGQTVFYKKNDIFAKKCKSSKSDTLF